MWFPAPSPKTGVEWPETPVFGGGTEDNTRGRVCSPKIFTPFFRQNTVTQIFTRGSISY